MPDFDHAQSPRLGQRTPVEATFVRMFSGVEIPEASWAGQIIWRTDRKVLQVYNGTAWEDVLGGVSGMFTFVGPSIPVSVNIGDVWYDSDDSYKLYIALSSGADAITGGEWILAQDSATAQATADAKARTFVQASPPPTSISIGDLWYNTSDFFKPYRAQSVGATTIAVGQWASVQDGYIGLTGLTASAKARTFIQTSVPTSTSIGDLWFDSDDGFKLYRAAIVGATTIGVGQWVVVQDSSIATAQSTADGKNTVYYAATEPTGGTYKINDVWFDTDDGYHIYTWDGAAWLGLQFGTGATADGFVTFEKIAAGAVRASTIDTGAISTEHLAAVIAIVDTALQVGEYVTIDGDGITISNVDPTKEPTRLYSDGGGSRLVGTANLDEVQINNNLTLLGIDNVVNGNMKLGTGFAEPTKLANVSQSHKTVDVAGSSGFSRSGLFPNGTNWITTDSVAGSGTLQAWNKTGTGGIPIFTTTSFTMEGGVVIQPATTGGGNNYFILGRSGGVSGPWRLREYTPAGTMIQSTILSMLPLAADTACIGTKGSNLLICRRVMSSDAIIIYEITTTGTGVTTTTCGTFAGSPTGVIYTAGPSTGVFAASRFVVSYAIAGIKVYSTAGTQQSGEQWGSFTTVSCGLYFDGTRFWGFDGRYTNQYSIEPGGSTNFKLAWVDNDSAGLGTAISSLGPMKGVTLTRFKWTNVSSPTPPDDGTTDGANTASIYVNLPATDGATYYKQTEFVTSPSVGGTPTSLSVQYDFARASTSITHAGTSGFAGRPSTAPGSVLSQTNGPSTNPAVYFNGSGQYRLNEATNLDDIPWTSATLASPYTNSITTQYAYKNGVVYIRGLIVRNGATSGATAFTLPTGLRPSAQQQYVSDSLPAATSSIRNVIGTDGTVKIFEKTGTYTSAFVDFSFITS